MNAAKVDKLCLWHPFTQMQEWMEPRFEPVVIVEGKGAELIDANGKRYLDGNSSIWTNLHGHRHPVLNAAIKRQLDKLAHSSFLGLTNEVAPALGARLLDVTRLKGRKYRVFFSDDGSTAIEAGLKMIIQARRQRGETQRKNFITLEGGYHGDTVGAMSLGRSGLFHKHFGALMFPTCKVMAPFCYRCPFNRARPCRGADARESRRCKWECLDELRRAMKQRGAGAAAFVAEPLVQGAAGMLMHPHGYLKEAAEICKQHGVWLMLDEVMTGFGRTGAMFAFQRERAIPDVLALAKGLSGGYLPLAATIASAEIFEAFLGNFSEFKTFFHGHSYTGNQLGCAAALANLDIFEAEGTIKTIARKSFLLRRLSKIFWEHPNVGDVRQEGMILAVELVEDFSSKRPFPLAQRLGQQVCDAARVRGLLTRPLGNVLLLMPPYCTTEKQLEKMVAALWDGLNDVLPRPKASALNGARKKQPGAGMVGN